MCQYKSSPPDECVIYYSKQDGCWIAHSLRTDQIATGKCVLDAYVALLSVIESLLQVATMEKDIRILREAPKDIQARAERAIPLPGDLCDYAYKRIHGEWPSEYGLTFAAPPSKNRPLKLKIRELTVQRQEAL